MYSYLPDFVSDEAPDVGFTALRVKNQISFGAFEGETTTPYVQVCHEEATALARILRNPTEGDTLVYYNNAGDRMFEFLFGWLHVTVQWKDTHKQDREILVSYPTLLGFASELLKHAAKARKVKA